MFAAADALGMTRTRGRICEKIVSYAKNWESLWKGSQNLLAEALQRIEGYYAVTIDAEIMSKAGRGFQEAGLAVIGILMAALLLAICCFRRGKWIGYGMLTFWFLAPFCVGTVIQADAMILLIGSGVGIYCSSARKGEISRGQRELTAAVVICLSVGIGYLWLREPMIKLTESPETFQKDVKAFLERKRIVSGGVGSGKIGEADELVQGEEEQLRLICNEKPNQALYLRGFVGGEYENSEWRKKKISSLKGKTGQEGEELLARPFELLKETEQVKRLTVQVQKANPKYRYEPYFSAYEDAAVYEDSFAEGGERSYETKFCTASEKKVLKRKGQEDYDAVVEKTYLEVPDSVAGELRQAAEETAGDDMEEICRKIHTYLSENTVYTLKPGRTPVGKDSVLYFLNENKKGYCMHYAAAAALLLRLQKIPARFVSGYLVEPGLFQKTGNGYQAVLTGGEAHAWAEYYVDGFGWVPFEATPGFVSVTSGIAAGITEYVPKEASNSNTPEETVQETEIPDQELDQTGEQTEQQEEQKEEPGTLSTESSKEPENPEKIEKNGGVSGAEQVRLSIKTALWFKILFGMIALLFVGLCTVTGNRIYRICQIRKHSESEKEMVCYLYERFGSMIKDFGYDWKAFEDAKTFAEELTKGFHSVSEVQAEQFYELAEQAYFGGNEFQKEDLRYMQKLYRKIRREGEREAGFWKKIKIKWWKNYDLVEKWN